jgi:hypothetical protein
MRIRDKSITAACRTVEGIEWTCLKIKQDGTEPAHQGALPLIPYDGEDERLADSKQLPDEVAETLEGDITLSLRTSELLMRTMEFPTSDPTEIAEMVGFQIDKVSPFPIDQLAISHEILSQGEETALVLMAAAKRSCIDEIGEAFETKGVNIHSIDARILGWLQLLNEQEKIVAEGCEIFILDDQIELTLVVLLGGQPIAFRSLHTHVDDPGALDELSSELSYTLTMLDAQYELPAPASIQFWNSAGRSKQLCDELAEKTELPVHHHDLAILPALSEGIVRRSLAGEAHIELIPREWIELQKRKELNRKFFLTTGTFAAIWLLVLVIFFSIYKARDIKLARTQERADEIAPAAQEALENRNKLKALKVYTDRTDSSLECLREITRMLPGGDIEFVSFKYIKGKGVTLRGTASNDDIVDNFFITLSDSALFETLKDQSVSTKTTKGIRRAIFSVTLVLPSEEKTK